MSDTKRKRIATSDEALLAELGYKEEFKRNFTALETFGVAFSIIGLLPSMASVLFYAIPNGGPVAMVWGWLVASFFLMSIGLAMAELGSAAPTSGGLYFMTHSFCSPRYRNFLSWIVGYSNTIGNIAGVASIDWGCAVQVMAAASIGSDSTFSATVAQTFAVYAAIIFAHAIICSLATTILARLQNLYIVLNVLLCLAVIIALPAATPKEFRNSASFALGNFSNFNGWPDGYAFILSLLYPLWTICAFDSTVHISEEASNAATAVPWAIIHSIAVSAVLGFAINISLVFCMGTDLSNILDNPIGQPMATIFFNSFGSKGTLALWAIVVIVQFMMGTSALLASSRQTFAFARDGALPFSSLLYRKSKRSGTPIYTVWFCAILALIMGALAFAGAQAINAVFTVSIIALYIAYIIPISARFIFKNDLKPGPFSLGFFSLPVAVIAVIFMSFMSVVFLFPTTPQTDAPDMNYSVVVLGGVLCLSVVWYYFPVYGGVHWFVGPVRTIDPGKDDSKSDSKSLEGSFEIEKT